MVVSPLAGFFSERFGSRLFMVAGLSLQALALGWLATLASVDQSYASMIAPFILAGAGMALVFAPAANAVLSSVRTDQAGQASGATNAIRELGGVLGIAVLATVFTSHGGYPSPQAYVDGLVPAMWVGAGGAGRRRPDRRGAAVQHPRLGRRTPRRRRRMVDRSSARRRPRSWPPERHVGSDRKLMTTTSTSRGDSPRQRVPAAERRDALIEAAIHEFAHGGLHGTPVDRIARRVGVAQPYVFSLFGTKRELFLAAVERCFEIVAEVFTRAAAEFDPADAPPRRVHGPSRRAQGDGQRLRAAARVRPRPADAPAPGLRGLRRRGNPRAGPRCYARLVAHVKRSPAPTPSRLDEFFRYGMWLNVAAAMGVEDLSAGCEWVRADQEEPNPAQE